MFLGCARRSRTIVASIVLIGKSAG